MSSGITLLSVAFTFTKVERHRMNKAENANHLAQMLLNIVTMMASQDFLGCDIHVKLRLLLGPVAAVRSVKGMLLPVQGSSLSADHFCTMIYTQF